MVLPVTRVVLYKHGIGYFEREGTVEGDATLSLTFKQSEVSDVLKSLTVLDLDGGHVASVSYDSTKPLEQLLAEVALSIPDEDSLTHLLPQLKGARVAVEVYIPEQEAPEEAEGEEEYEENGYAEDEEEEEYEEEEEAYEEEGEEAAAEPEEGPPAGIEGLLLGMDTTQRQTSDGIVKVVLVSLLIEDGTILTYDLHSLVRFQILDEALRRDLDYYLRTQLSAKKKDARTFTFFTQGEGERTVRVSYTLEAPVWKATYRILLGEEGQSPMIQGWAVVDNTQDEDWENVRLSLIAGLPVSFIHDLYTPRYVRRPVVEVQETTGVLPPEVEEGVAYAALDSAVYGEALASAPPPGASAKFVGGGARGARAESRTTAVSSMPAQVRERKLGDLFEYEIEHPVTIRRNQSALVPIVLRAFRGRPVLLYNKRTRAENPLRAVEFENTTGLTLEGGPVTVLEAGNYVGEAMLDTLKPHEQRLVPYAVELVVSVLDNIESYSDRVNRVIIRQGQLTATYAQVQQTTCTIHNKGDVEQTFYLDHTRPDSEWELFDMTAPQEITENYWRFRFALPARKVTKFVVRQRRPLQNVHALKDVKDWQLALWIEERYLDAKTEKVLRQVVELRQRLAGLDQEVERMQQERKAIHEEQKRIRENLQSLGDRPSEKELRERFVRTLNTQEDGLETLAKDLKAKRAERETCLEQIAERLASLEFEKTM